MHLCRNILYEFKKVKDFPNIYPNYLEEVKDSGNFENDALIAARIIMENYIKPGDPAKELPKRQDAAAEWYRIIGGGNL